MKYIKSALLAVAVGALALAPSAQATITLGDLVANNGSISIPGGDKTFSGFGWVATAKNSDANILADLNSAASQLQVSAFILGGVYYLDFSGAILVDNLAGLAGTWGDLKLAYTVTANPGAITMIDQQYTPNGAPVAGNQIIIGETVFSPALNMIVGNSTLTLNPSDLSDPAPEIGDSLYVPPSHRLDVQKDILIAAAAGQIVGLSDVRQSFHQTAVPEASTVIAGALLLLPLGASALRIVRRNRPTTA